MGLTRPRYSNIVDTDYKQSCRIVTTTNITLSGGAPSTYDGIALASGDRILVNAQSTGTQNGIYFIQTLGTGSNGTWTRTPDAATSDRVTGGMSTIVTEGTYAGTPYRLVQADPITLDSTSLSFASTAATVSGTSKSIQYNNAGFIAGAASLVYDNATGNVVAAATTASTNTTTGALVVRGGVGIAGTLNVGGVSILNGNVVIVGNLTTLGNTFITNSTDLSIQDSIINLHTPTDLTPLVTNDGLDIGLKLHYYDTADSAAFVGRDNATGYLVWEDRGTDVGGVFTGTSVGTFKTGNVLLVGNLYRGSSTIGSGVQTHAIAYTTSSATPPSNPQVGDQWYDTSTDTLYEWFTDGTSSYWIDKLSQPVAVSFASQATPPIGAKLGDSWYDTSTDTLYNYIYDGSSFYWVDFSTRQPAAAAAATFFSSLSINTSTGNIVINPTTTSTSTTTGALVVKGGVGIAGNLNAGTSESQHNISGNIGFNLNNDGSFATVSMLRSTASNSVINDLILIGGTNYSSLIGFNTASIGSGAFSPLVAAGDQQIWFTNNNLSGSGALTITLAGTRSIGLRIVDNGAISIGSDSYLFLNNSYTSTSTITGALVVPYGGVGIGGNLNVGGAINASNVVASSGFTIGSQVFYAQGTNGFSVNENYDPSNNSGQTAYHFASGATRANIAFTLARTGQFTDGFGVYGTSADNTFVTFGEQSNTSFEWRKGIGIQPLNLSGGTQLMKLSSAGNLVITNANLTLGNVTTGMVKNGYDVTRGTTFANIDNVSASMFANGVPAFSSVTGTMNYFWSAITNLTGGKFFGNTSTGGAVTTLPTSIGSVNGPIGSGGDTVTAILQDQDLKRAYRIIYMQTVTAGSCSIVVTRIV